MTGENVDGIWKKEMISFGAMLMGRVAEIQCSG